MRKNSDSDEDWGSHIVRVACSMEEIVASQWVNGDAAGSFLRTYGHAYPKTLYLGLVEGE